MVNFSGSTIVVGENPDGFVEAGGGEFFARRCEINVQNGRHVVLVDHLRLIQTAHVKSVAVGIFVADDNVHRLLWIPA